jgi:hypothetical protein
MFGSKMGDKVMSNYWAEEDEADMPDWMKASTHRNGGKPKNKAKSLEEAINQAMKQPPIDTSHLSWDQWKPNEDIE